MQSLFIITVDLNLLVHIADHPDTLIDLNETLDNFNLKKHGTGPTHNHGHTLDLTTTHEYCEYTIHTAIHDTVSDHFMLKTF